MDVRRRRWPWALWLGYFLPPAAYLVLVGSGRLEVPFPSWLRVSLLIGAALTVALLLLVLVLPRGRAWLQAKRLELLLATTSLVVTTALVDLLLTVTGVVPTIEAKRQASVRYGPSVGTRHRLLPLQSSPSPATGHELTIDGRGLRTDSFDPPGPKNRRRILVMGGSHVFDRDGLNWPARAAQRLREAGKDVEVINAGTPGHCSADVLTKLTLDLWTLEPDAVVVCCAWNDIKYFSLVSTDEPYRSVISPYTSDWRLAPQGLDWLLCHSSLYRLGRIRLITSLRGSEGWKDRPATGRVGEVGPRQFELNLVAICAVCRAIGAKVFLCKQGRLMTPGLDEQARRRVRLGFVGLPYDELLRACQLCDEAVVRVAKAHGASVIDFGRVLSGHPEYFNDHIHLSEKGSEQAAQVLAEALGE